MSNIRTLKDIMITETLQEDLREHIDNRGACPRYYEFFKAASVNLGLALNIQNIPDVSYSQDTSASFLENSIMNISKWIDLAGRTLGPIIEDYVDLSDDYRNVATRIFNESAYFEDRLERIIRPACTHISSRTSDQTMDSNAGKIGKYIVLPFFLSTVKMYNSSLYVRLTSSGEITFSNAGKVNKLPLNEWLSAKVMGGREETVTISGTLPEVITSNAFYYKLMNDLESTELTLLNEDGTTSFTKKFDDGEVFANYEPVQFNRFIIKCKYFNSNTDKPYAIKLIGLEIFEKIHFAKNGVFESTHTEILSGDEANDISIIYNDSGDITKTRVRNLLSVSTDTESKDYNIIEEDTPVDISVHKYRHHKTYDQLDLDIESVVNIKYPDDNSPRNFERFTIDETADPDLWEMDANNAIAFHGLPKEYARTTDAYAAPTDLIYENWTKVGNYYITMVIVYEENVVLDLGDMSIKINGRERTGKVTFEKGISAIEVHKKYIDFKFGKISATDLDVTNQERVLSDPLFPFNFAYMLAGLPDFTTDGRLTLESDRVYSVTPDQVTTILLGEPFLPLTVEVTDGFAQTYELVLTKGVSSPGTFSIEPYSGKIKIYAGPTNNVTIKYRRANPFRRPVGILFNRLLTFMPIKTLLGLSWRDDLFFSLDSSVSERFLLLQQIPDKRIAHSQIIFNKFGEGLYAALKLELETTDRYLTPILKDMYILAG